MTMNRPRAVFIFFHCPDLQVPPPPPPPTSFSLSPLFCIVPIVLHCPHSFALSPQLSIVPTVVHCLHSFSLSTVFHCPHSFTLSTVLHRPHSLTLSPQFYIVPTMLNKTWVCISVEMILSGNMRLKVWGLTEVNLRSCRRS